jgi:WS/DGAT/MGAT family acyltransferase
MAPYSIPRERFFNVDAAWLHMDAPANTVTITALALFQRPLDHTVLRAVIEDRLLAFPRFRQRVREPRLPFTLPEWEPDSRFDLEAHLHRVALPAPGDWPALLQLVESLMRSPLPTDRPLWQMHLVENFGTGCALVTRLSHAVADGVALVHVLSRLTGETAEASLAMLGDGDLPEPEPDGWLRRALGRLDTAVHLPLKVIDSGLEAASHPLRTAEQGLAGALALGKLLFILPDQPTRLRGRCGVTKRATASDPIPLAEIKRVGHALDAKVNDVILAAVAGGFRRYLVARGEDVTGLSIRAMVPVYLGNGEPPKSLRNGFGLTFLSLPVGVRDPVRRLRRVHANMDEIKGSPEAAVAFGIMYGMGLTPPGVDRLIANIFALKGTAVMTNVVGPKRKLYLAGVPIDNVMFWVPQPAGLAVGLSIMSYAGQVTVCLATDACVTPDPEAILEGFNLEFDLLRQRADRVGAGSQRAEAGRCQALTRAGRPCRNPAGDGGLCAVHRR